MRKKHNNLNDWLSYLESIHPKNIDMDLNRIRSVYQLLNIAPTCPVVTIAGTNGKGTTVAALQTLASAQGWRVGVYTSPHLFHYNERIVLDLPETLAKPASDEQIIEAFEIIEATRGDISLTYFEFATLAALFIFKKMSLDLIILEVGLGGRLDSTNIIDADIAIITRIAFDHMDYLGNTLEAIAAEKAGIMRAHKPCIYGGEDVRDTIEVLANQHHAVLQSYQINFAADKYTEKASLETRIPLSNLSCAKQAFLLLGGHYHQNSWEKLLQKKPLGRFTSINLKDKTIIFDVAHNPDSMNLLAQQLKTLSSKDIRVMIGMLDDKDHHASLSVLKNDPRITFYVSSPQNTSRAAAPQKLMAALENSRALSFNTLKAAWEMALKGYSKDTIWIATGSFFTVAEVWEMALCYT